MRIVVDLQGLQTVSRHRGIGRYVRSLTHALLDDPRGHELVLLASATSADTVEPLRAELDHRLAPDRLRVWFGLTPTSFLRAQPADRAASAAIREAAIEALEPDAVLVPSVFEGHEDDAVVTIADAASGRPPTAAILYDLVPLEHADTYLDGNPAYRRFYEGALAELQRADRLLAISAHSGREATELLGVDPARIAEIGAAADERFVPATVSRDELDARCRALGVDGPFYLYTGGGDARKNLRRLVEAHAALDPSLRSRTRLVLAGSLDITVVHDLERHARKLGLDADGLVFLGHVGDDELVTLYQGCRLFVFPSWSEGFGLPPLEAMSCGVPVVASDVSAVPEVVDLDEARFDPFSVPAMAAAIERGLTDEPFRERLVEHGLATAGRFTWARTAASTLDALEALAAGAPPRPPADPDELAAALVDEVVDAYPASTPASSLVPLAFVIEHSLPRRRPRRVFVDVSVLRSDDVVPEGPALARPLVDAWLADHPGEVRLVAATLAEGGYRLVEGDAAAGPLGELLEPVTGDVLVALAPPPPVLLHQLHYLRFLRTLGVSVELVEPHLRPDATPWHTRRVAAELDGVHLPSPAAAAEARAELDGTGPPRHRPLRVEAFPPGSAAALWDLVAGSV